MKSKALLFKLNRGGRWDKRFRLSFYLQGVPFREKNERDPVLMSDKYTGYQQLWELT